MIQREKKEIYIYTHTHTHTHAVLELPGVFKLDLEKAEEPEIKLPTSAGS